MFFFFFNDTATTEIYTLSLHDALPILSMAESRARSSGRGGRQRPGDVDRIAAQTPGEKIGRAHVELQSPCNLVCRLLLEKKKHFQEMIRETRKYTELIS